MNEIIKHIKGNTYYIPSKTNIGLYLGQATILIDSGNDKEAGRKLRQVLDKVKLKPSYILNTHSNADHIGANEYLMKHYDINSYSYQQEVVFSKYTQLESSMLYGGYPTKKMKNKFLMAKPCHMLDIELLNDLEVEFFELKGHFLDMIGYKTKDNVYFIADSVFSQDIIDKYHIFYIYDVQEFLKTLDFLEKIDKQSDTIFVASHVPITSDLKPVIEHNRAKVYEIIELIKQLLKTPLSYDLLLQKIFNHYQLILDLNQYLLVGSCIRNYLSYLIDLNEIDMIFEDNTLTYHLHK